MGASASVVEMVGDEGRDRSGSELRDSERKENKDLVESDESSHYVQNFGNDGVVDHFVKEMYMSSPKIDALQHVLSSDMGRIAFMEFLRTEYAEENLSFFIVSYFDRLYLRYFISRLM